MIKEYGVKFKSFLVQCTRVWHILRKPTMDEYKGVSKIAALGILAIGAVGFLIADIMTIFSGILGK